MGNECRLPFPRGGFASDGVSELITSTDVKKLCGRQFDVPDTVHGYGRMVRLRAVMNDSGSDITVARKGYSFSTDAGEVGGKISGVAASGEVGYPLDDAYTVGQTWLANDIGYIVVDGRCDVLSDPSALGASSAIGARLQWETGGTINDTAATTGDFCFGELDEKQAATNTAYRVLVHEGGLNNAG